MSYRFSPLVATLCFVSLLGAAAFLVYLIVDHARSPQSVAASEISFEGRTQFSELKDALICATDRLTQEAAFRGVFLFCHSRDNVELCVEVFQNGEWMDPSLLDENNDPETLSVKLTAVSRSESGFVNWQESCEVMPLHMNNVFLILDE